MERRERGRRNLLSLWKNYHIPRGGGSPLPLGNAGGGGGAAPTPAFLTIYAQALFLVFKTIFSWVILQIFLKVLKGQCYEVFFTLFGTF